MSEPELEDFRQRVEALRKHPHIKRRSSKAGIKLRDLTLAELATLMEDEAGHYFLTAAAGLNRTALKKGASTAEANLVEPRLRRAFAVQSALPVRASFEEIARTAVAHRQRDLRRRGRAQVEGLFRDRLKAESIPLFMSPPIRRVPELLIDYRKPDGVYPDPATGAAPKVYLEIKNIRRVSDDIQKRLYELAETSLEMKILYGDLNLKGFDRSTTEQIAGNAKLRESLRAQIRQSQPVVVAFFICPRDEAERYREGAEAFIDRLFFQEEVEECLRFLDEAIRA